MFAEPLGDDFYICSYSSGSQKSDDYVVPRNAAVQIAAAITAYGRIYMHPYINRSDSYYTDTDSVVLGSPLLPSIDLIPSLLTIYGQGFTSPSPHTHL